MSDLQWKTAVSSIQPNEVRLRGYRIDELMGQITFGQAVYLALRGELPSPEVGKLMDAMLVSSIDHGATTPSALAARTSASTGAPLNGAVAAGILSINRFHGGAIEGCMRLLRDALKRPEAAGAPKDAAAGALADLKAKGQRAEGFGHRVHTDDPRTRKLFALADEAGLSGPAVRMAQAFVAAFEDQGKHLPINVDGAIAALLLDLGFEPAVGNAFFMTARLPGLVAQVMEEQTREKSMRRIHPSDVVYDGPEPRELG